jgi:UPF0755 protein
MPRRTRRSRVWLGFALAVAGCLICAPLAAARWSTATAVLGPPSSSLPGWQTPLLAAYLLLRRTDIDSPAGDPRVSTVVEIEQGETAADAVARLADAGVIDDPFLLRTYLRYRGLDVGVEAGRYSLEGSQTVREIAAALQRAVDSRYTLLVVEGWRREQIAQALGQMQLEFSPADFLSATRRPPPFDDGAPAPTLEGFLFPDSYRLDPRWTADDVASLLLDAFARRVDRDMQRAFEDRGLTTLEAVTLASVIEREAALPDERPIIASVFLNRLAMDMKLQSDPTVQFALGLQPDGGWWKSELSVSDLETDSPYNTYLYAGLPPGPIANPGLDSLRAVADPAETGYYYFRAACDDSGAHVFSETFEEHLQNSCP